MAQNENISLSLANKVDILNKSQSVDARYGIYDTESDALDAMLTYGADGRQVAVYTDKPNGKVRLYLYNEVLHQLEPIIGEGDIEAIDVSFDDTTTQLGETNVQGAIEKTNERIDNLGTMSNESASDYTKTEDLADVALSNDYNDLDNLPTIPTKTSNLTNDSGFITSSNLPAPQSLDDVLGVGDVTDKEAKFQSEISTQYSLVNNERVISGDVEKGSYTKIDYNGIEHVPHVGRGIHNVIFTEDVDDGEFEHTFPAKSGTVAHLEDIENHLPKVYSIEITLSKSDINNLHTTPIVISSTDLGLESGQGAKFLRERTEVKIFTDGAKFNGSRPIQIGNGDIIDIMDLSDVIYAATSPNGTYAGSGNASFLTYKVVDEYSITTAEEITGGGVNSFIKFTFFYEKINL